MRLANLATPAALRIAWQRMSTAPGGKLLFSKMIGRIAPYSGTINARILELESGHATVQMRDRHAIRNHLKSIHAIALMNLAEITTGVAIMVSIPDDARGILTNLSIDYLRKARGTLTSETRFEAPTSSLREEYDIEALIRNDAGDVVAKARARWMIGPR